MMEPAAFWIREKAKLKARAEGKARAKAKAKARLVFFFFFLLSLCPRTSSVRSGGDRSWQQEDHLLQLAFRLHGPDICGDFVLDESCRKR